MKQYLQVTMPDGSIWDVPVDFIVDDMAKYFSEHDGVSLEDAREEILLGLEKDDFEIQDWAVNNLNWSDVKDIAVQVKGPDPFDYEKVG